MAPPSNFVSFADYLGLNQEAGNQMTDRTLAQGDTLRDEAYGAVNARDAMAKDGAEAFESGGERVRKGLASYGEFMKGMQDPAYRQTLMEKVYGKGTVSALDSALVTSTGGGRIGAGVADAAEAQRYGTLRGERGASNASMADQNRSQDSEFDASQAAKRAAHQKAMLQRDVNDENARVDDWVRNSGDAGSAFGQNFDPRTYNPDAMVSGGSSMGWDLFKNPMGNQMNVPIKARDAAASQLKNWEAGRNSYASRKWVKGASAGGGGYDDSAIAAEQKRRWSGK